MNRTRYEQLALPLDECPAGGEHTWVELTAWEAGPGSDPGGWCCDEYGARPSDSVDDGDR